MLRRRTWGKPNTCLGPGRRRKATEGPTWRRQSAAAMGTDDPPVTGESITGDRLETIRQEILVVSLATATTDAQSSIIIHAFLHRRSCSVHTTLLVVETFYVCPTKFLPPVVRLCPTPLRFRSSSNRKPVEFHTSAMCSTMLFQSFDHSSHNSARLQLVV
ncbi:P-loop containing nucleoside triphosphatehydrolases superfamily protein [Striga asiatica]|uniref:P-loop containing nucleoside triphosphatehydrolases superfamily protein n=1 Tax=Striga asiatica TaxID=4170 RepID=A0A5A7NYR9_STRAF|nr:P-loop containing nucleoside triphosphatehydrolases superfamily protein [Striga asiatica]